MSADLSSLLALGPVRAAAFWLERLDHDASPAEQDLFVHWLAAGDANREAWDRALDLWDSLDQAHEDGQIDALRQEALTFRPRRKLSPWMRYTAAASVAAAACVLVFVATGLGSHKLEPQLATARSGDLQHFGAPDYQTAVGKQATYALSDGTTLTLDTDSAVDIAYQDDARLVRILRGQVFFDVAHNAQRPFRVAAGDRIVSDLGTRFNIQLAQDETRVLLVAGAISVSKGSDPANPGPELERLSPGEQVVAQPGAQDHVTTVTVDPKLAWQRGFVQFDGQTLAAAIAELNRYTDRKLFVRDPKVAALKISGAFPTNDTDNFVETLTALYPVRVVKAADGRIEIVRRR